MAKIAHITNPCQYLFIVKGRFYVDEIILFVDQSHFSPMKVLAQAILLAGFLFQLYSIDDQAIMVCVVWSYQIRLVQGLCLAGGSLAAGERLPPDPVTKTPPDAFKAHGFVLPRYFVRSVDSSFFPSGPAR